MDRSVNELGITLPLGCNAEAQSYAIDLDDAGEVAAYALSIVCGSSLQPHETLVTLAGDNTAEFRTAALWGLDLAATRHCHSCSNSSLCN